MFYRVTNAIIAPDLIREFSLNTEELGMLGSIFFYAFALLQIPMGMLLDRFGPRVIIPVFSLIGALGALVFATATTFTVALSGRALTGIGMASVLMGSLKVFVSYFPQKAFSTLSGTMIAIGTTGSILATSPLAYLNTTIGWRATIVSAGIITAALALCVPATLKQSAGEAEAGQAGMKSDNNAGTLTPLMMILTSSSFWCIGAIAFCRYGTVVALQGLWLGPYLMNVRGFSPVSAGNILMMLSAGMILGSPIAGYLSDRVFRSTKQVMLAGLGLYTVFLLPLTGIIPVSNTGTIMVILFFLGFFSGFGMLAYTHIKELNPPSMSATAIAAINFFVISGGAIFMQVLGNIIGHITRTHGVPTVRAFHIAFAVCFFSMVASLLIYGFSKKQTR